MACFSCGSSSSSTLGSRPGVFAALSRAAAKSASARLRQMRIVPTHHDWAARAAICEQCPMRVVAHSITYCGTPFLKKIDRDPIADGCGCPTVAKAKDASEHCPLNARHGAALRSNGRCDCKWCGSRSDR